MKPRLFALELLALLLAVVSGANAEVPESDVKPAYKDLMKLTDHGPEPKQVVLPAVDGSVFFLNTTKGGLATLSVDFAGKRPHCASPNVTFNEEQNFRSAKPIGPNDFAVICFPDKGRYAVRVQGLDGSTRVYEGAVIVE